ncbi:MAG: dihydroorotate dehydrogenase electron transfer subunit [Nitrospinae bacterium]|nr:dihydroorotate dehydrogenase electron transfer subunit [Nitrospinota bacterium]
MTSYRITQRTGLAGGFFHLLAETDTPPGKVRPGSFVMIRCADGTDPYLRRPMSVADFAPDGARIGLLIQNVGRGTGLLAQKSVGDTLDVIGPFGTGLFVTPEPGTKLWLVAGGTGIAPFLGYVENNDLSKSSAGTTLFLGARREELLFFRDRFAAATDLDVALATEDGSAGEKGFVTAAMERRLANGERPDLIYTCGPTPMMKGVAAFAKRIGARCMVSLENRMACGFGACLGCVQKVAGKEDYTTVCKRGPVFDAQEIEL